MELHKKPQKVKFPSIKEMLEKRRMELDEKAGFNVEKEAARRAKRRAVAQARKNSIKEVKGAGKPPTDKGGDKKGKK